jgi:hypothetical protein
MILEEDPSNSYKADASIIRHTCQIDNSRINKVSKTHPVLDISGDRVDGGWIYSCNGVQEMTTADNLSILGYEISIDKDTDTFKILYMSPAVSLDTPNESFIQSKATVLHDAIDSVDMSNPWDRAALFCLYVLRSHNVN